MVVRKRFLISALLALAAWYSLNWIETNLEIVTLHTRGRAQDHYTRLFIVDDDERKFAWIRAERPDRLWLEALRAYPEVVVRRGVRDIRYRAVPWNGSGGHRRVDALFRAKYGVFDLLSGFVWRRDAVPIRLELPSEVRDG